MLSYNKSDSNSSLLSGVLHLGACPNQEEEEQEFEMTAIEALRLQLDDLKKEKHAGA